MALPPIIDYDAYIVSPGVNLTLTGRGTPSISAAYGDFGSDGGSAKANCVLAINYTNIGYVINDDNSITVSGNINGAILTRTATGVASPDNQQVIATFNGVQTFNQLIATASSGTYDLNIPSSFSVTIAPSLNPQPQYPASIFFSNDNTTSPAPPDQFYLGIIITNPNPPDYRPGAILDGSGVWQSHNRSGGEAHILTGGGNWSEMRTLGAPSAMGNPPSIRKNNAWYNMAKLGKEN